MKMTMAKAFFKKTTLFATAFVLAVSTMTAAVPFVLSQDAAAATNSICAGGCDSTQIDAAITTAVAGDVLSLDGDITLSKEIKIDKQLTIVGNGHSINAGFAQSGANGNAAINLLGAQNVVISNVVIKNVGGSNLHGINAFKGSSTLNGVTISNFTKYGLVVNGSNVTVNSISTSGNGWGGVDVDQSSTSNAAKLTVNGASSHTDVGNASLFGTKHLFIDNVTKPVSIVDTANQYDITSFGNARFYKLKVAPVAPSGLRFAEFACGGTTNVNSITPTWNAVAGATSYNYRATTPSGAVYGPTSVGNVTSINGPFGGEGVSKFAVQAVNGGLVSPWSTDCSATYDATAPIVTSTAQVFEIQQNGRYAVTLTFNEAIDTTSLQQGWSEVAGSNKTQFVKRYYSTQQFTATFKDLAGNSVVHTFVIAPVVNAAPVVNFIAPTPVNGTYVKGIVTTGATATDDWGMGGYYLRFWKNAYEVAGGGTLLNSCYSAPGAFLLGTSVTANCSFDVNSLPDNTKVVVSAQFIDGHNAWGTAVLRTYTVDKTAPTISIKNSSASLIDGTQGSNPYHHVSFKLYDAAGNLKEVELNGHIYNRGGQWNDLNWANITKSQLIQGVNTIIVRDKAGNESGLTFIYDSIAPDAPVLGARTSGGLALTSGGLTNSYGIVADWDDVAGTSSYIYKYWNDVAGSAHTSANPYVVNGLGGSESAGVFNQGEGTHYMQVFAVDAAGNVSAGSNVFVINYDATAPVVTLNAFIGTTNTPTLSGTADPSATAVFLTIGTDDEIEIPVNGGLWSYVVPAPLAVGTHAVSVVAKDLAGNRTLSPAAGTLTVAAPAQPVTSAPDEDEVVLVAAAILPVATVVPATTGPSSNAGILGDAARNNVNDDASVEGASTKKNIAEAVNSEANQGTFMGLGWYWWLLILAAIATFIWWIIAAIRKRRAEA